MYNAEVTGIDTLANTRDYLIERGMSDYWADKLMHQYLAKVTKESYICTVLDLFSRPEAKGFLHRAKAEEVYTNYVNLHNTTP